MQSIATNTMVQPNQIKPGNGMATYLNNGYSLLSDVLKKVIAFSKRVILPFCILIAFLFSGVAAMAQCPPSVEGSITSSSNSLLCSGQTSSININVTPTSGGTFSGSFMNGRTFGPLTPAAGIISPSYTFINNTQASVTENFVLATLVFTPANNIPMGGCSANSLGGSTNITIQPVSDIGTMLNTPSNLCNNGSVSITVSNPNGVGGTYNRSTNYGAAGHTASTTATGQAYGTFTDMLTNSTASPINVVYTFTPISPGSLNCVGAPMSVTVTINPNPTITCPANKTVGTDPNVCTAVVTGIDPVSFSPATCNGVAPTITYSATGATTFSGTGSASGQTFSKGMTTVTYNIKDAANNTGVPCSFNVTVNDTQGPTFTNTLQTDISVTSSSDGTGNCSAVVTYSPYTATDNCGATPAITYSQASGTPFPVGMTTVTVTAKDDATPPNTTTDQFTVTVTDNENPTITCPGNFNVNNSAAPNDCGASVTFAASASDNCSATITYTIPGTPNPIPITSPYIFPVGTTTVTATATDPAGNASSPCTFTVTVNNITGNLYVNDGSTTGDTYTLGIGSDVTGNGTRCRPYATINQAILVATASNTIYVDAGTFVEDVTVNKQVTLLGAGYTNTTVSGPIGGAGGATTIRISAAGIIVDGFKITREGNNPTDYYNSDLNSAGIAVQGQTVSAEIRNNWFFGNRTGIDINNSNGNNIHNNLIESNRTGLIFRNQTDNTNMQENFIRDNFTVGVVFLDASGGSNSPVQTAANSTFNNNFISGNWYGDVVDRQSGGSLPAPGTNIKNFECNWYGQSSQPTVTTNNSTEPGYGTSGLSNIPTIFGGTATAPAGPQPDIAGPASANIDYTPWLVNGTDNNLTTSGFQPVPGSCTGTPVVIASAVPSPQTCSGNGSITVMFSGGTGPYSLTYTGPSSGGPTPVTSPTTISGLVAGTYTVTITDANGSFATAMATITNNPVTNVTQNMTYTTIQAAVSAANTNDVITVCSGTYNEQVVINTSLTLQGTGATKPIINFTGAPAAAARRSLFDVTVPSVTIKGFEFRVNITQLHSAIIASPVTPATTVSNLTVQDNDMKAYQSTIGTSVTPYMRRNAVSINFDNLRVNGANPVNILGTGNTVSYFDNGTPAPNTGDDAGFRSGFAMDEGTGTFTGNTIQSINQDIQSRFASAGSLVISNNNINGGGIEIAEQNAGAGTFTVSNNIFNGTFGSTFTSALRLKNNTQGKTTTVSGNTFTGHNQGISLENYRTVTVDNNVFTPATGSTTYRHITVNTKEFSGSSGSAAPNIDGTFTNNTFNGSGGAGGLGLAFYNQDNNTTVTPGPSPVFGTFTIGTSGNENNFAAGVGTFIFLDNTTGTTGSSMPSIPFTTTVPFAVNLDATNNKFDVGSGLESPSAMSLANLFLLEDKVQHKIDATTLGFVLVKTANTYVTTNSFVAPNTAPAIQRGVDAASAAFTVNVTAGTFTESINVNKTLNVRGAQADVCAATRTGAETIISCVNGIGINSDNTTLNGFTIQDQTNTNSAPGFGYAVYMAPPRVGTQLVNNVIKNNVIGSSLANTGATQALIQCNWFDANNNTGPASGNGIYTDEFTGGGIISNVLINSNKFSNNQSAGITISTGTQASATTGVSITNNVFTGNNRAAFLYNTNNSSFSNNEISGSTFNNSGDLRIFGGVNTLSVFNNKFAAGAGVPTGPGPAGIRISDDGAGATSSNITVFENSFTGYSTSPKAIEVVSGYTGSLMATCNWFGTVNANTIATQISGPVTYSPYLTDGTDASGSTGFQPVPGSCTGTPVVIASAVPSPQTCSGNGSITVMFSGGTGPYSLTYTGPSSGGPTPVTSPTTISGLVAGTYTVTITDANGSFATAMATITNNPVRNVTQNMTYTTIQGAVTAAAANDSITVCSGTYNEQVVINKSLKLQGLGPVKPIINYTGTPAVAARATLFDVTAPSVTIRDFDFRVNLTNIGSAILASAANISNLVVDSNEIKPYRSGGLLGFGVRNAVSINYAGLRINGANPVNIFGTRNVITYFDNGTPGDATDDAGFRSGFAMDEATGAFDDNTIQSISQDIQSRFASAGSLAVTNNKINGGGVEIAEQNAGAGTFDVSGNTFNGTFGSTYTSALRLKNNTQGKTTTVSGNTFTGHNWGISLENYRTVTVNNNAFTPVAGSTTYRHITVNTKELSSSSGSAAPNIDGTFTNNTFNGSGGAGGLGLAFYNQDNNTTVTPGPAPVFGTFTIGTAGNENNFNAGIGTFIFLDNTTGTTGTSMPPPGVPFTTTVPFAVNLDATNNKFDVGSGLESPSAMSLANLFLLEDKVQHKIDTTTLGFVLVKANNTYVTPNSFIAPSTEAKIQRGVDAAGPTGFTENVQNGTYRDNVIVNKEITITGQSQAGVIIVPAISNPNCGGAGGGSLCGGTSSNVFLVQANNVTIQTLTADGNNPALTGTTVNGVDIDARNGIITDHNTVALVTGLNVNNVTVKNMFLRGIYASTDYGTFNFDANMVTNVAGITGESFGILNFGGSGSITNNNVSGSYAGIGTQNSFGTTYSGNTVTDCIRGIEADNSGAAAGSAADLVTNNIVTNTGTGVANSFGITVFNPYVAPTVQENTVTNVQTGLANVAQVVAVTPVFTRNTVNGNNRSNSIGILQSTNSPFGNTNVSGTFTNNFIQNNATGVRVEYQSNTNTITANNNSITGNTTGVQLITGSGTLVNNFECNWWGSNNPTAVAAAVGSPANTVIDYIPYLSSGAETDPTPGFQPTDNCAACTNVMATATQTTSTCAGNNDGVITVSTPTGGTGPYTFTISGPANTTGATSGVFSGLSQGTYTITVFQGNGCSTALTPVLVKDQVAPTFTSCPAPVTGQTPNTSNCQSTVDPPDPTATDNCPTGLTVTYELTGVTGGSGTAPIGAINFNVGTTTITYTATDQSGNTATCSTSVTVVNNLAGNITGTATVAQNNATTSNITFSGSGGTKPYKFTYNVTVDNNVSGGDQTVSTTNNNSIVTVPQSNAVTGRFIYTLVSIQDANGCFGALPMDNKDTITVVSSIPRPDLFSTIDNPLNSSFSNGETKEGLIMLGNASADPTTGTIEFRISNVENFTLELLETTTVPGISASSPCTGCPIVGPVDNSDFTFTPGAFFTTVTSKPGKTIGGNSSKKIGYKITAIGSAGTRGVMTVSILDNTGGSSPTNGDSGNFNNQSTKGFSIN